MRVRTLVTDCDIRSAVVVDAADIVFLTQRGYSEPVRPGAPLLFVDEDEESVARDMDRGWRMMIAHHGGLAVGAVRFRCDGDTVRVARLVVDPLHRRRGIGSALLRSVEQEAAKLGIARLVGEAPSSNGFATYFERHGFTFQNERMIGPLRFVEMVKSTIAAS
jgi:GNAT superfamily N-acetyltransferase